MTLHVEHSEGDYESEHPSCWWCGAEIVRAEGTWAHLDTMNVWCPDTARSSQTTARTATPAGTQTIAVRDLGAEIIRRDVWWDVAGALARARTREAHVAAGWKVCAHEACPPWDCRAAETEEVEEEHCSCGDDG